ncbi:MAG TPA: hypothetical protein VFF26_00780 [Gallionella sp.]|nr:hypothetical protein [Gallionella sp.]
MMIFQEAQGINAKSNGYTWDESWGLPYESLWSLLHKFSLLNHISLAECKRILKPDDAHGEFITELGGKLSVNKLGSILGIEGGLGQNLVHKIVHQSDRSWLVSPQLRSCQECLRYGYHSVFHQILSIKKCPVHQTELTIISCDFCGRSDRYDSFSRLGNSPYTCPHCGRAHWHPYDDTSGLSLRKLLALTGEQKGKLDALHDWFVASAKIAPYGASLKRWEGMAGSTSIGLRAQRKSIYELRGHEIPIFRGQITGLYPPVSVSCSLRNNTSRSIVQYGAPGHRSQLRGFECHEPRFSDIGILCLELDKAQDFQTSLRQVYKSIRRNIAKVFLNMAHRRCANSIERALWWEPTANSNTRICPWAFAYLFWRRNWEIRMRTNSPNKYANWKNFLFVNISDGDPVQNEWTTLRIFALECYWTFQECVLLARGMHRQQNFSWDPELIRGRLIPYWHINNLESSEPPSIYWWCRQPIHSKAFRLHGSLKHHRKDVAEQVKTIYWLPVS